MRGRFAAAVIVMLAGSSLAQTNGSVAAVHSNAIAVVLGKPVAAADREKLGGLVLGALLERYARENNLEPTGAELDAFVNKTEEKARLQQSRFEADRQRLQKELLAPALTAQEREEKNVQLRAIESILKDTREIKEQIRGMEERMRPMRRRMAQQFVRSWKINKALYDRYGGRVIFQQAGVEPLDAYRLFLKDQEKAGAFQILDKQCEAPFWRYYTNDAMHSFCKPEESAQFINTPWWMMEAREEE